jgi:hypothetical protein
VSAHRHRNGRTSHCRGASNWRCGAHLPRTGVDLGQADPCIARRQDRRGHTSEVPRRSFSRAGGVAGVCRRSVGTSTGVSAPAESAGRSGTDWWDASSGHGRAGPRRLDVGEGRLQRNTRFEGRTSSVTRLARQGAIGVPPGAPPRTAPGHRGGQRATHATHRPVTDGVGNAFAMRRPGVRIPAAPPTTRDRPLRGSVPSSSLDPRGPTRSSTGWSGRAPVVLRRDPSGIVKAGMTNTSEQA